MNRKRTTAAGLAALTIAGIAVPGASAGTPATPPPADPAGEAALRAAEARVLGAAHAAEHAQLRRAIRQRRATARTAANGAPRARASAGLRPVTGDPTRVGRWGAAFSIPVMAVHGAVLPTGKVLWFSYPRKPTGSTTPGQDDKRAEPRARMALGSPHRRAQAGRPTALARPRRRSAQARQHLVRRPVAHGRRPPAGHRRQPRVRHEDRGPQGPEQGLHVQPLHGVLDRAAQHACGPLVSHERAAPRWAHGDHERPDRFRHPRGQRQHDRRAVHPLGQPQRTRPDLPARPARDQDRPAHRRPLPARHPDAQRPDPDRRADHE